jgi:diacylglycerol kinase
MLRIINKFGFAVNGLKLACKQSSFLIQLVAALITVVFGLLLILTPFEWIWIISCITSVLTLEMINTALEQACDLFSHGWLLDEIKLIKDVAAGAVLVVSIGAMIIGAIIFLPHLMEIL